MRMTQATARRLFDLLTQAEMAFLVNGTPHADYLRPHKNKACGQLKKELEKIVRLGPQAALFVDYFIKEFNE